MDLTDLDINLDTSMLSFTCPYCKTKHDINDAIVERILDKSEHVHTSWRMRYAVQTYRDTYYNVRFCPRCFKRKHKVKKIIGILMYLIPLTWLVIATWAAGTMDKILVGVLPILFICWLSKGLLFFLLDKTIYDVDFEEAHRNNALASPWE